MEETGQIKRWIRAENGKVSYVLEYEDGHKVQVPINSDGSIKWHEDIAKEGENL